MANLQVLVCLVFVAILYHGCDSREACMDDDCPEGMPITPLDPDNPRVFADMTEHEMNQVLSFLFTQEDLRLVDFNQAQPGDNFVMMIETLRPVKHDVLNHLDHGATMPDRQARVVIYRTNPEDPGIDEYAVGPLPNPTEYTPLELPAWSYPIPYAARNVLDSPTDRIQFLALFETEFGRMNSVLSAISGGYTYGNNCTNRCLIYMPAYARQPEGASGEERVLIFELYRALEGFDHHPLGVEVFVRIDNQGYSIQKIWLHGVIYNSVDEILEQFEAETLGYTYLAPPETEFTTDLPSSMNFRGDPIPEVPQRGPKAYYPDGRRYKIDNGRVFWQGWEFEYGIKASTGVQVFDIRFKGDRIAYEISLQELGIVYSGASPYAQNNMYHDSFLFIGVYTTELIPGIDCPEHATMIDSVQYRYGQVNVYKNAHCIFEHDNSIPLRRHRDDMNFMFHQGMRDNVLIFRTVPTVYNYDYVVDIQLHQGGQIKTTAALNGYTINYIYLGPESDPYGYELEKNSMASIHNHLVNFKVDLDIKGTSNRFQTLDVSLEEIPDPTYEGETLLNRKFERSLKETEEEAAIRLGGEWPRYLIMYNENERNKFENPRGYRILPVEWSKMLLPDNYRGTRNRGFAKYQVAVTKLEDGREQSSNVYATASMEETPTSLDDLIADNENIVDEDLVAWVTLGSLHIPHTEDVPVVMTTGVQLSFWLFPFNYYDEDPSMSSRDNIRVDIKRGGDVYHYSGQNVDQVCRPTEGKHRVHRSDASKSGATSCHVNAYAAVLIFASLLLNKFV